MKNKKYTWFVFISLCTVFFSCSAYAKESVPYVVSGDFLLESKNNEFELCGLDLYFLNKSEKKLKAFTVCFYLFDQDGEPISTGKNHIVMELGRNLGGMESFKGVLSLDKYFSQVPDEKYSIDYLYVSRIEYEDGSVWSDPFGMMVF